MSGLKLYYNSISPPCRFLLMLSRVLPVKIRLKEVDILSRKHLKELTQINPQHTVPILQDKDFTIWESHAIAPYLVNRYHEDNSLYPKNLQLRALVNQRLHFDTGILYPCLHRAICPILFHLQHGIRTSDVHDINVCYSFMDKFAEGSEWLCGTKMTLADLSCLSTVSTLDLIYPINKKKYPNLTTYFRKCEDLPFYDECNVPGLNKLAKEIQSRLSKSKRYLR